MKKVYQQNKWKNYSKKRSKSELIKKRKEFALQKRESARINAIARYHKDHISKNVKVSKQKKLTKIDVPENFSIKNNINVMLEFFDTVYYHVSKTEKILFEMSHIKNMTADAILYMLSVFEYYEHKFGSFSIQGNYPEDEKCRELLLQSGFLEHVQSREYIKRKESNVFSIESNRLVVGNIAKNVIEFSKNRLKKSQDYKPKEIYATMIEAMANTRHHAYNRGNIHRGNVQHKWWLIAHYIEEQEKVNFTFLDNGRGMASTMNKKLSERMPLVGLKDGELILSALKGKGVLRTSTEQPWRGRGLPKIMSYSQENKIDNLIIVANKGYVDCKNEKATELESVFHGSLLSWDFI